MLIPLPKFRSRIKETANYFRKELPQIPKVAVMLGSGLGGVVDGLKDTRIIPYSKIPHLPKSTVKGHHGQVIYGKVNGKAVMAFQGRWHHYEGIPLQHATMYVRVLKELGVRTLIITNAAGGLQKGMKAGDIMLITDHINMMGENPLIGPHDDSFGIRFPDMINAYDPELKKLAQDTANKLKIKIKKGVYLALSGPKNSPCPILFAQYTL